MTSKDTITYICIQCNCEIETDKEEFEAFVEEEGYREASICNHCETHNLDVYLRDS